MKGSKEIRKARKQKEMERKPALVSIITVTYNARRALEKTMESVQEQKKRYPHVEYIIVDGASSDGTPELVRSRGDLVDKWVSEPDKGIYDAMNKGLKLASGDFVWFLNAGDFIYSPDFLKEVFDPGTASSCPAPDGWADIYYGQTQLVNADWSPAGMRRLRAPAELAPRSFGMGMLVCHQSILVRRELASRYDTAYRCSADFNWVLEALEKSRANQYTHRIVSCYLVGGKSKKMRVLSWKERFSIMRRHFGLAFTVACHFRILLRAFIPQRRDYPA